MVSFLLVVHTERKQTPRLPMHKDRFDQPITTSSPRAAELYDEAVDLLFALQPGSGPLIDEALTIDPDFALAHCVKARSLATAGEMREARRYAALGRDLALGRSIRERHHAAIIDLALRGESARALRAVREHAAEYPRDAVPLSFALGVYGLLGFGGFNDFHAQQATLLESVSHAWGDDWWFLAAFGWALVEAGCSENGVPMLDRAMELNPDNANAVHGRVHGYYEEGAAAEGEALIDAWLPGYDRSAVLHGHLSWHSALFALQLGHIERAFAIYRDAVRPSASHALPMFTLIDAASFSTRAAIAGHPLSAKEQRELARFAQDHFPKPGVPFVNAHLAMAHASVGDVDALSRLDEGIEALLDERAQSSGPVVSIVCGAIGAHGHGRYATALERMLEAMPDLERLGGSHAQRDVFIDLAISAAVRAGAMKESERIARERWTQRARHLDADWLARLVERQPHPP